MSAGADGPDAGVAEAAPGGERGVADKLGIRPGALVQSLGHEDDLEPAPDAALLADVVRTSGEELVPADSDDVVDVVLLWWRSPEDGADDLVDALVDARRNLDEGGVVWLLVPKTGRDGHVSASDVQEAVPTAGLAQTSTVSAGPAWTGIRLVAPKTARARAR